MKFVWPNKYRLPSSVLRTFRIGAQTLGGSSGRINLGKKKTMLVSLNLNNIYITISGWKVQKGYEMRTKDINITHTSVRSSEQHHSGVRKTS